MIYTNLVKRIKEGKQFTLLIDPDEHDTAGILKLVELAKATPVNYIFVGGSLISSLSFFEKAIQIIKENTSIPVVIFPGNYTQISSYADAILLLNLISGRNPDYLIGQHVMASKTLKKSNLEIIPTGYILIENGKTTTVEYISNTKPIPTNKIDIIVSTAIAGEQMGNKLIYLEAGSGAVTPIHENIIREVKANISIPLIVGGGVKNKEILKEYYNAGADMVVVGNALEEHPELIYSFF